MEYERGEREQFEIDETVLKEFWTWAKDPKVQRGLFERPMTEEEKAQKLREIFGLPPDTTGEDGDNDKPDRGPSATTPSRPPKTPTPSVSSPPDEAPAASTHNPSPAGMGKKVMPASASRDRLIAKPPSASSQSAQITPPARRPHRDAQIERSRRYLFDEIPNAPPELATLGVRAKAEVNIRRLPADFRMTIIQRRLFGERPKDFRPALPPNQQHSESTTQESPKPSAPATEPSSGPATGAATPSLRIPETPPAPSECDRPPGTVPPPVPPPSPITGPKFGNSQPGIRNRREFDDNHDSPAKTTDISLVRPGRRHGGPPSPVTASRRRHQNGLL
jgi:hypothetical protein